MASVEYLASSDPTAKIVVIDYKDLLNEQADLSEAIKVAYGFDGLGLLAVRGVPNLTELRKNFLPLAHKYVICQYNEIFFEIGEEVGVYWQSFKST
jgi:hypothetical protein